MELGYACINLSLGKGITTNRSMIKKTFTERGLDYVSELAILNARNLYTIMQWNVDNDIRFFRMSSNIVPWGESIDFIDLKDYSEFKSILESVGNLAKVNNIRVTSHPGPFVVLTSPKEHVVDTAIAELEMHGRVFDLMGLSQSPYNKINIHCNGVYGDKLSAMNRFVDNFKRLSTSVQPRLTIENDDKASMYSVSDLMYIHDKIGIPIVFDYHHYQFNTGGLSEQQSLELAISTWPIGIQPVVHYSESKKIHENNNKLKPQAHSDYINELPNTYGNDVDIMLETKKKDLALLNIRKSIKLNAA
jgi:UV DNA damage endonuclease